MVAIMNHGELVAQAPTEELLECGDTSAFTLAVKGDSASVEARLRSQPWVTGVDLMSRNGSVRWQIRVSDPAVAEARLVPLALATSGVTVCEFGRNRRSLEDIFLEIVKESNS
jgi:ABC-type multidrug transport system ATPase subunit